MGLKGFKIKMDEMWTMTDGPQVTWLFLNSRSSNYHYADLI